MNYIQLVKDVLLFASQNKGTVDEDFRLHPVEFYDVLNDLIDEGYIKGKILRYKPISQYSSGRLFNIDHVTLNGKQIIETLDKSNTQKIKDYLKENGFQPNLKEISKLVFNIMF